MSKELVEDCFTLTPACNKLDYERKRKFGVDIEYHIEADGYIIVTVGNNEPQRIEVAEVWQAVACRRYFICPGCDKNVFKLYLPPNGKELRCRTCHGLVYTLTTINKTTPHGKMLYTMNRMDKLSKQREKMGTILYKGKYTKSFRSFLKQCVRAGYTKAVEDAAGLMTALKEFQRV